MAALNVAMSRSRFVMFLLSLGLLAFGVNGQSGSTPSYNVTITATPSTTNYTVGDSVTLICMVDPPIASTSVIVTYSWQCDGCFADGDTDMVIMRTLTDMDTSMINCSATVDGVNFTTDEPFDLQVTQAPTPIVSFDPSSPIQGIVGSPLTIECRVDTVPGVSTVSISWTGPRGPIMNNPRMTISPTISTGNVFTSNLSFTYLMEEADDGNYTCEWMILTNSGSQSVELQTSVPAPNTNVRTVPSDAAQMPGKNLTVECQVTIPRGITSTVDVVWSDDGSEFDRPRMNNVTFSPISDSQYQYTDSFTISPLRTSDEGRRIECLAVINTSPTVNDSSTITLDLTVNVPSVNVATNSTPTLNEPLTVQCYATTTTFVNTRVDIEWDLTDDDNDEVVFRTIERANGTLSADGSRLEFRDSFTIAMLNESHNDDMYKCVVTIFAGTKRISEMANVSLEDLGIFVPTTVNLNGPNIVTVGQNLTLECVVNTVENIMSRVDIVWRRNGMQLERTNNVTGNITSGSVVYSDLYMFGALTTSDNGTVVECEVVINVEPPVRNTATPTVIVVFVPTSTVTISPPGPLQGVVGDSLDLICTVSTFTGVELNAVMVMWLDSEDDPLMNDGRVTISPAASTGNNTFASSLSFAYLMGGDISDEGTYTCNVMILDASGSDSFVIESLSVPIPTVTVTLLNRRLDSSSPPMLQCEVTTVRGINSTVDIVWSNGTELDIVRATPMTVNNLSIYMVTYTIAQQLTTELDGAVYSCEAVINSDPVVRSNNTITLDVIVPQPTVNIMQSPIRFVSGLETVLTCTVTVASGVPSSLVNVNWSGRASLSDSPRVTVSNVTNNGLQYTTTITFSPLLSRDGGQYTCSVSVNGFDEADNSESVMIMVNAPELPVVVEPPEISGNASEEAINLTCTATLMDVASSILYQLIWLLNGARVDQSDPRIMIDTNADMTLSTLFINESDTMASDSGIYTCRAVITVNGTDNFTSDGDSQVTLTAIQPPLAPYVTEVITTPNSAIITWIATIVHDDETYTVYYGTDSMALENTIEGMGNASVPNEFSATINGLMPFTTYNYIVSAVNSEGTTNTSVMTFMTNETAPAIAPSNFRYIGVTATSITFEWDPLSDHEVNGMIRNYTINCAPGSIMEMFVPTTGTINGLSPFTNYTCTILVTTVMDGPMSDPITVRTNESAPYPPIIDSVVGINDSVVRVSWSEPNPANGIITMYTIFVNGSESDTVDASTRSYDIIGLSPNQLVTVTITATNGGGTSNPSVAVGNRSSEAAPGIVMVNSTDGAVVTWNAPAQPNGNIINYQVIYYIYQNDTAEDQSNLLDPNTLNYTIPGTGGIPYEVVVVAYTSAGRGDENDDRFGPFFTEELPPLQSVDEDSVNISQLNETSVNVTWTPLSLFYARGFPEYVITLTLSDGRKKRQSPQSKTTSNSYVVFGDLTGGRSYSAVVGSRTGGENDTVISAPAVQVSVEIECPTLNNPSNGMISCSLGGDGVANSGDTCSFTCNNGYELSGSNTRICQTDGSWSGSDTVCERMTSPTSEGQDDDDDDNTGAVVGGVVAALVVVVIIIIVIIALMILRQRRRKSYNIPGNDSTAAFINKRVVSPTDSDDGGRHGDIAMQPVDHNIEQRLEPVSLRDFSEHVKNMHKDRDLGFEEEYGTVSTENLASYDASQESANIVKNRYANIFPYDFARVKVTRVDMRDDDTDYINASYMDGYTRTNAYIAAQGPLPETVKDFWQMVWDHKAPVIVMLTKLVEADVQKCEQYWPDSVDETINPKPTLSVKLTQIQRFADYELRTMTVAKVSEEEKDDAVIPLEVKHFFFTSWPDHGVPQFATALISFIKRVRQSQPKDGEAPLIVHCSAGVGRTGTYITLDTMLERIKHVDNVNVYECVRNLRAKRVFMVQTQAQYTFIHDALEELITCGDTSFNVQSMRVKVNRMGKVNPETELTGFQEQFQLLEKVCRKPTLNDCADSQHSSNKAKNRFGNIMPYDSTRVVLKPVSAVPGSDYINASRIDGYKERNAFIATQCPMENTVGDFWRMIWENKSAVIVLLCDPKNDEKDFLQFWPNDGDGDEEHGQIKVTRKSHSEKNGYMAYKFSVIGPSLIVGADPEALQVTMLHYTGWPNNAKPTNNSGLLGLTKEALELQRNTGNRAMTVVCSDGCGRTGTFVAIYYTIERLKVEGTVDIFQAIKNSRLSRSDLVSSLEQYESCHEVVLEFLDEFEAYANFK